MGRVGISQTQTHKIPWEALIEDGSVSVVHCVVLERWKGAFEQLLNNEPATDTTTKQMIGKCPVINDTTRLNAAITEDEVRFALISARKEKSLGEDGIPEEVLLNNSCLSYLVNLFNACFDAGHIPDIWSRGIICPVSTKDHRDPLNYREITVTSATYKLFCSILNNRLTRAMESNGDIADEQNGYRAGRNASDHIGSLSLILDSCIKMKKDTFAVFIDFSKAYDRINRALLWHKLSILGINGKMLNSIKSLYEQVKCTIRINGTHTEWFCVNSGLKQGCILFPQSFNMFANDLVHAMNELNCGLSYSDDDHVSILLYANDIVLLSDDKLKIQTMLDCLNKWCRT